MRTVAVSGSFDHLRSRDVRFLEEAARLGAVHVLLWPDQAVRELTGAELKFPELERKYYLEAIRFVHSVRIVDEIHELDQLPHFEGLPPDLWAVREREDSPQKRQYCETQQIEYQVIRESSLEGFPIVEGESESPTSCRKVLVTGCYDWFHSGHIRFFEETSQLGDLYVVVGHDENVRLLKGEGHPLFSEQERRYMVGSIRYVKKALISSGSGWMDAEPEILAIRPDIYAVNEDGDKPEKREYCRQHGLNHVVLKRVPAEGLPRRESTQLRGF